MNVLISSDPPKHLRITQTMLEDLLWDPVMAAWVFFKIKLDAFQAVRLRIYWFTPDVEDHSGFTSGKTIVDWVWCNLSAVLLYDCHIGAIFQTFQIGKDNFWQYYKEFSTPIFRAQLGLMEEEVREKSQFKEPGCWKQHFKNRSMVAMPAPGFLQEARNLAGWRVNRLLIDEWTKIMMSAGGAEGIQKQLLGRVTRPCYNANHPIWCNKVVRSATAELGNHPGFRVHREYKREVKRGNPDYWTFGFSYKNYSNLRCHTGKTFKEQYRDEKRLRTLKLSNTPEKFRAEGLGLWQKQSKGWYTSEMIDACQALGRERKLEPILSRATDPLGKDPEVRYFLGVDPAPSQGQRSDEGAIMILRARPAVENPSDFEGDWTTDFVYARKIKGLDAEAWSGVLHEKHQDFGISMILLDLGGGGQWIAPEMRKSKQLMRGIQVESTPIVSRSSSTIEGHLILCLFSRGDEDIKKLWPDLKHAHGDDVLKDAANTLFQTALSKGMIGLPIPHHERAREEMIGWVEEKVWASKLLTLFGLQTLKVQAETDEQGNWKLTKNNARRFFSTDKDDFHDSGRNAYIAFRIWLLDCDAGWCVNDRDAALCRGR